MILCALVIRFVRVSRDFGRKRSSPRFGQLEETPTKIVPASATLRDDQ
jgi:hypothetical protein